MAVIHVKAAYDRDAGVWYVAQSSLTGVFAEGQTADKLAGKLIVEELTGTRSPIEFEAHLLVPRAAASGEGFVGDSRQAAGV
jgi:hypothetical protein